MIPSPYMPERHPPQFGLKLVFAFTSAVALALGVSRWFSFSPTLALLLVTIAAVAAYAERTPKLREWIGLAVVLSVAALFALILPALDPGRVRYNIKFAARSGRSLFG